MRRWFVVLGALCCAEGSIVLAADLPSLTAFPRNYPNAPTGPAQQDVYPYPGQCWTVGPVAGRPEIPECDLSNARSFACEPSGSGFSNQTAGPAGTCGAVTRPKLLNPVDPTTQAKFQFEVLNPLDYTPDTNKFWYADYYEIAVHEAWGFQGIATAGLFPDPTGAPDPSKGQQPGAWSAAGAVPDGMQWTGLVCPRTTDNCAAGQPIYTPVWGIGQKNMNGGPVTSTLAGLGLFTKPSTSPEWSRNDFVATWPSISIRGTTGRPVVVKWVNEFPNNHLFCPHPEAADWPCGIDRTFMGVKASVDPATVPPTFQLAGLPYNGVNQFGGPQQPDNSWVTHLHGGDIPPATDGFAEKWFGNLRTGRYYSPQPWLLNPAFNAPRGALPNRAVGYQYGAVFRPGGDPRLQFPPFGGESSWMFDTYAYPMVNQESTIWFHDHTLGKTHHNVIAGPAAFYPVKDPSRHGKVVNGVCKAGPAGACDFTWLDPLTEPRNALGVPLYDLFLALQDRAFNDDGSFNFPNGMSQPVPLPVASPEAIQDPTSWPNCLQTGDCVAPGTQPVLPGPNPQVHPTWVPEYFADHTLVNGVLWPRKTVAPGWYRIRVVDGSDARCWNLTLGTAQGTANGNGMSSRGFGAQGPNEAGLPFVVIASEQGYLPAAVGTDHVTLCPGERYEFLIDFSGFAPGTSVYLNNNAAAPFPDGVTPQDPNSPFGELATVMRFDVVAPNAATGPAVPSCGASGLTWNPARSAAANGTGCVQVPDTLDLDFTDLASVAASSCPGATGSCVAAERTLFLSEKVDGVTGASLGLNINGMPFEHDVTETPRKGTYEVWHVVNTTVDAHPLHPHLGRFQILRRDPVDVGCYKTLICGSPDCQPGPAPGSVQQLIPDYRACLIPGVGSDFPVTAVEKGWKDTLRSFPGEVLTFIGKWDGAWAPQVASANAPGAGNAKNPGYTRYQVGAHSPRNAKHWTYTDVTSGPYVWHCHINSHEDSEMMRSTLVVK